MLLAEELALVAIDPDSGRHALGIRAQLNACLAGLLLVEQALDEAPDSRVLVAAGEVLAEKGGNVKHALSHMDRGLDQRLGAGTWDSVVGGLIAAGVVAPAEGTLRPHNDLLEPATREAIVERLRTAAAGDERLDVRTASVLSMTGPAQLLEVVAPHRKGRQHARRRIDHALDDTELADVGGAVRKVIADAVAAVTAATVAASAGAVAGNS